MKRIRFLIGFFAVFVCVILLSTHAQAASNKCGENLTWSLDSSGIFRVSGEGPMYTYDFDWEIYGEPLVPWCDYRSSIKKIVIEDGVTSISPYAFYDCGNVTEVVIGNDVETIGPMAFYHSETLNQVRKITIGSALKEIGVGAFNGWVSLEEIHISNLSTWCTFEGERPPAAWTAYNGITTQLYLEGKALNDVVIPDDVTSIADGAFADYEIKSVKFHNGVISIGNSAFYGCGITSLELPDSLTYIGDAAFGGLSITEVQIPNGVTVMDGAFWGCDNLVSATLPNTLKSIARTFYSCDRLESVTLPEGLTSIGERTFYNCDALNSITIPDTVVYIGEQAFADCERLKTVMLPDNMQTISNQTFMNCVSMTDIILPSNLTVIGNEAFLGCSLARIVVPDKVTKIGEKAFSNCLFTEVVIPDSVICMDGAFSNCTELVSIVVPNSITDIGDSTFYGCNKLTDITMPENLVSIGEKAFYDCNVLSSIALPGTVESLGNYVFYGCEALVDVALSDSLTSIGAYSFGGCSIAEITIPGKVTTIGAYAFEKCVKLKKAIFEGAAPTLAEACFSGVTAVCYYPEGNESYTAEILTNDFGGYLIWTYEGEVKDESWYYCGDSIVWEITEDGQLVLSGTGAMYDYSVADLQYAPWYESRASVKSIQIGEGITYIGDAAFYYCSSATAIDLPDTLIAIGDMAFQSTRAKTVDFPDGLDEIGDYAFRHCGISNLELPGGISEIGEGAFYGTSSLNSVVMNEGLTYISDSMFAYCYYLHEITFPNTLVSIGNRAFSSCFELYSVVLPEGLKEIGEGAFAWCGPSRTYDMYYDANNFTQVTIPDTVIRIGKAAFSGCQSLTSIDIPDGVTVLESGMFTGCYSLRRVTIPAWMTRIEKDVFADCNSISNITFEWNAPEIDNTACGKNLTATCYYPSNNPAWTSGMLQNYGANQLTWVPQEMEEPEEGTGGGSGEDAGGDSGEDSGEGGGTEDGSGESTGGDNTGSSGGGSSGGNQSGGSSTGGSTGSGSEGNTGSGDSTAGGSSGESDGTESGFGGFLTNMTLGNSLDMNIAFAQSNMTDWTGCYAQIIKTYTDGTEAAVRTIPYEQWVSASINDELYYYVTFDGIAAKEMTDTVTLRIYDANGQQISEAYEDSVRAYAMRVLNKEGTAGDTKTMLVDLLNYGAAAQEQFSYSTGDLATALLTDAQKALATESAQGTDSRVKGDNYLASSLVLKNNIQLLMLFENIDASMYAVVTFTNHYDEEKSITVSGDAFEQYDALYAVVVDDTVVADARKNVTCTVFNAAGEQVAYAVDSVESYVARMAETGALYEAILKFADSAHNYFHPATA